MWHTIVQTFPPRSAAFRTFLTMHWEIKAERHKDSLTDGYFWRSIRKQASIMGDVRKRHFQVCKLEMEENKSGICFFLWPWWNHMKAWAKLESLPHTHFESRIFVGPHHFTSQRTFWGYWLTDEYWYEPFTEISVSLFVFANMKTSISHKQRRKDAYLRGLRRRFLTVSHSTISVWIRHKYNLSEDQRFLLVKDHVVQGSRNVCQLGTPVVVCDPITSQSCSINSWQQDL